MIGQRPRWHPLARGRGHGAGTHDGAPLRVAIRGGDRSIRERLDRLAAATGALGVVEGTADAVDVVVVPLDDGDPSGLDELRRAVRGAHRPRTVVIARGTDWFELAFDAGADVWVDADAEDDTILAALLAPLRAPST